MADRPIIFSAPMVRALLDGRKTQTRRVLKPQPGVVDSGGLPAALVALDGYAVPGRVQPRRLPYAPGDRLWVREAALFWRNTSDNSLSHVAAFKADGYELEAGERWRPSIHMPRWASRLTLIVTDVRVQRLQEISEADAIAEGCDAALALTMKRKNGGHPGNPVGCYRDLWNSLHGPGAWDANPWVVALTFTVQRGNIDQLPGVAG